VVFFKKVYFSLENDAIMKNSPLSLSELAGVSGKRAVCLATRVEKRSANVINGEDFVTVQNSAGSMKFDLNLMQPILTRFKPDFFIGPFDDHPIPMSLKRVRKAVDRNLKYEKKSQVTSEQLELPFISSISGAEILAEKERNILGISEKSSGIAFCDLHKLATVEERLNILKAVCEVSGREGLLRIVRGSVSPVEMAKYLPYTDMFDTTFVDEITGKGYALILSLDGEDSGSLDLWDEKYFEDFEPISKDCHCNTCKNYKRTYVHHLLKSHEMLGGVLLMMHNLFQYSKWLENLKLGN
jgi:queuine tRNA-ribosyltransferase accessory subunit